ncbi:DEAD/DEAH box helicase family protein [Flavobacterium alkalisoli]|uniref:DEAD/DEAH box helicase family protein n=1 Tax=Flavobacterium alkalisoli TaxID=2602769 RepID=UPI003A92D0A0
MNTLPENIKFKYSWRKYQERVLHELEDHLYNRHLHVIAPPGSGKTILGLEVMKRLNQPTLVLAPTIAIRNQWIQRFCELFLDTDTIPDWISRDIKNPKFLTISTYQGMHAACNNRQEKEEDYNEEEEETYKEEKSTNENLTKIVNGLKTQNVKTIVIDEAHHLKNEWWDTLTKIKKQLDPVIVALTATPPYDVSPGEWHRYTELNGPVDTEITVPELVKENDLCPHQDYVYFTLPSESEKESIDKFRDKVKLVTDKINTDTVFITALESHPVYSNPFENLEWIYDNFQEYINILIFLNSIGKEIPLQHFEVIGDEKGRIPKMDKERLEALLDFYLFKEKVYFEELKEHKDSLANMLRHYGMMERKSIKFELNRKISANLTSSISKLDGIKKITDLEFSNLKDDLRLVILCDFIRKDFYTTASVNNKELDKVGVMPTFEKLRRGNSHNLKIGVLTGSLIIIPKTAYSSFKEKTEKYNIRNISCSAVPFDDNYLLITPNEQLKHDIVTIITQVFEEGEIQALVGTKSLLGEGWDAPCINALILASFVGSFVLSNQMRGRAIRAQRGNNQKTGNIWHIVCIDPTDILGGTDLEMLRRRFKGFVGVSFKDDEGIENGIARLDIPKNLHRPKVIENKNEEMFSNALKRDLLRKRWEDAIKKGFSLVEEIKIPFLVPEEHKESKKTYPQLKDLYFNKTIGYFIAQITFGIMTYGSYALQGLAKGIRYIKSWQELFIAVSVFGGVGFIAYGRQAYKAFRMYVTYRDITEDIKQIARALFETLLHAGHIHTPRYKISLIADVGRKGDIYCYLQGGTSFEKSIFIESLMEIVAPVDSPRYIIIRKSKKNFLIQRDYHAVPDIIGRNKKTAEHFAALWEKFVGDCELIYTRTPVGRRILLKSRLKSLSAQLDPQPERGNKWR